MRNTLLQDKRKVIVLFDGSCPLCKKEIGLYRNSDVLNKLCFVDISDQNITIPSNIDRNVAMSRFHVVSLDGQILSGVSGFIEVWQNLRGWRWLAKIALIPCVVQIMEVAYILFLATRHLLLKVVVQTQRHKN